MQNAVSPAFFGVWVKSFNITSQGLDFLAYNKGGAGMFEVLVVCTLNSARSVAVWYGAYSRKPGGDALLPYDSHGTSVLWGALPGEECAKISDVAALKFISLKK